MTAPKTMRAMILTRHGGMDAYEWREDWPTPDPGPHQALIKTHACGLNNTDVNTRSGWYSKAVSEATTGEGFEDVGEEDPSWGGAPLSFPRIQGADICGEVIACGDKADSSLIGKRVIADCWLRDWDNPEAREKTGYLGSEADGGFAEYCVIDHRNVIPVECDLSSAELATFSCSYSTAEGMLTRASVKEGDTLLITGASGGVGSALIQLAKRRGARVIAMASEAKHAALSEFGADRLLPRASDNLKAMLENEAITVIADVVGGDDWPALIDALAPGGRYVVSGAIAGPMVTLDLRTLYLRDLSFFGSTVISPQITRTVARYIEAGEIKPVLAATYKLEELRAAQAAFIEKRHVGNIVVVP